MRKCFWLLSDRKTVREIPYEEYRKLAMTSFRSRRRYLLAVLFDSEIYIRKGRHATTIPLSQLNEILKEA